MGARYLTPTEFAYIKELLKKYRHDVKKVSEIHLRSRGFIAAIDNAVTFEEYKNPNKGNSEPCPEKKEAPEKSEAKSTNRQYDGAILSEMARLRKAIENLTVVIESKPRKKGLFG